ncbi:ABC transporter substrate-binding protein [Evansella halocellulosilytica]|uniref:ABC transporter substrate-binding protein n=1 Tax=Evansella halocellulosilytica TaxID=2011013 RepID=UPI000BB997CD|nr:extracellular solute-binding protein [Evansella halocellulosilytica]
MKKLVTGVFTLFIAVSLLAGCGGDDNTIEFFQNKPEAVETFDALIEKFNEEHPEINIEQNFVPEAETVIMSRLTQGDMPDIMGINGNATYGELAESGTLHDFSEEQMIENVQSAYVDMLNQLSGKDVPNGIPYATNANTVLYNKDIFAEIGIDIPVTWDEFVSVVEMIETEGYTPFYHTYGDAWTAMVAFNALAGNLEGDKFAEERLAGETTFEERHREVAEKMLEIKDMANNDIFGTNYDQGNAAFSNGDSAMYIQGNWAIGEITEANPDMNIGAFALPVTNEQADNRLISGVDTVLTVSEDTPHKDDALLFIEFLLEEENARFYIDEEKQFSAVEGVIQEDGSVVDLSVHFEEGTITSFPDHYYPTGMQIENLVQEFLIEEDIDEFLNVLDNEWEKVTSR